MFVRWPATARGGLPLVALGLATLALAAACGGSGGGMMDDGTGGGMMGESQGALSEEAAHNPLHEQLRAMMDGVMGEGFSERMHAAMPGSEDMMEAGTARMLDMMGDGMGGGMMSGGMMGGGMIGGAMHGGGSRVPQTPVVSDATQASVEIRDFDFFPRELTVKSGTAITWVNRDAVPHDATDEAGGWGTDILGQGKAATLTFDTPGTYPYYCTIHPNMRAVLNVV